MHACLHYYSDYKLSLIFLFSVYIGLGAWGLGEDITQYMGGGDLQHLETDDWPTPGLEGEGGGVPKPGGEVDKCFQPPCSI